MDRRLNEVAPESARGIRTVVPLAAECEDRSIRRRWRLPSMASGCADEITRSLGLRQGVPPHVEAFLVKPQRTTGNV